MQGLPPAADSGRRPPEMLAATGTCRSDDRPANCPALLRSGWVRFQILRRELRYRLLTTFLLA